MITLVLTFAVIALYTWVPDSSDLYFSLFSIESGNLSGLISGHFTHSDLNHLIWNAGALAILAIFIERHSKTLLFASLLTGLISVNALLLSDWSTLEVYCGLSGVLNSLLVVALWLMWRESRSPWAWLILVGAVAKVAVEIIFANAIFSQTSWPPFPQAHAAGMVGGICLVVLVIAFESFNKNPKRVW